MIQSLNQVSFLQKIFHGLCSNKRLPRKKGYPRGLSKAKKDDILKKLLHLMLDNPRRFWETLPECLEIDDLPINLDHLKNN